MMSGLCLRKAEARHKGVAPFRKEVTAECKWGHYQEGTGGRETFREDIDRVGERRFTVVRA